MTGREYLEKSLIDMSKIADNLQTRIYKAIAFLETNEYYVTVMYDNVYEKKEELLDILKGSDTNVKD